MPSSESLSELLRVYGRLFEASPDGVIIGTRDGVTLRANDVACRMLGFTEAELASRGREGVVVDDDASRAFVTARRQVGFAHGNLRMRRSDGSVLLVEATSWALRVADGAEFAYVVIRDASALRDAEQAVRDRKSELDALLAASLDAYWLVGNDGGLLDANAAACNLYGYTRDEMLALRVGDIEANEDAEATRAHMERMRQRGWDRFVSRHRRKGGAVFDVEASVYFTPAAGGRFVSFIRDISERLRSEEALRESERRYRALAEVSPNAILTHRKGVVEYANPAAARLAGAASPADMVGHSLLDFVHPDWRERERARTERVLAGGDVDTVEMPVLVLDGSTRVVECALSSFTDSGGPAVQVSLRDVTEERALQARLQVASRLAAMGTLVSGVAHEVNNPLTGLMAGLGTVREEVKALSEAAAGGAPPAPGALLRQFTEMEEALELAAESTERIARIVKDLAVFGGPTQERARVRLPDVAAAALRWLPASAAALATVRIEDRGSPEVMATRGQIEQVLVNLLSNAAKATPPGRHGDVLLRIGPGAPGMARVEVIDHGTGIAPNVIGRIFDPFFTTRPAGERRGTGLGLAICHVIVHDHGGTIAVTSEPGKGSTFVVELPAAPEQAPADAS